MRLSSVAVACRIEGVPRACGTAAWGELVQMVAGKDLACEARIRKGKVIESNT